MKNKRPLLLCFVHLTKTNTSKPVARRVLYWSSTLYETQIRLQRRSRVEEQQQQQQQEQKPRPTQNHESHQVSETEPAAGSMLGTNAVNKQGKGTGRYMFLIFCVNNDNNLQVSVKALIFKVVLLPCLVIDKSYPGFNAAKMSKIRVWKSERH